MEAVSDCYNFYLKTFFQARNVCLQYYKLDRESYKTFEYKSYND